MGASRAQQIEELQLAVGLIRAGMDHLTRAEPDTVGEMEAWSGGYERLKREAKRLSLAIDGLELAALFDLSIGQEYEITAKLYHRLWPGSPKPSDAHSRPAPNNTFYARVTITGYGARSVRVRGPYAGQVGRINPAALVRRDPVTA